MGRESWEGGGFGGEGELDEGEGGEEKGSERTWAGRWLAHLSPHHAPDRQLQPAVAHLVVVFDRVHVVPLRLWFHVARVAERDRMKRDMEAAWRACVEAG